MSDMQWIYDVILNEVNMRYGDRLITQDISQATDDLMLALKRFCLTYEELPPCDDDDDDKLD